MASKKRHRLPELPHVKYVEAKGQWYAYFNTGKKKENGAPIYARLPHPSDIGFYDSYTALKAGRTKRAKAEYTVACLVKDYRASSDFADLKKGTRTSYGISLDKIEDRLGEFQVDQLTDEAIQLPLDNEGWGASTQNLFVAVLRGMYKWARSPRRKKASIDPMRDYDRRKTGEHQPWPLPVLLDALKAEDASTRLAVHLLYYTGQRIGDVCKMRWNDIQDDGTIYVRQQKTDKEVWPPIHSALQAQLEKTPKRGITILCNAQGRQFSIGRLRSRLQELTRALGYETVPHGLRKNAVNALLECGCSVAEVSAITGQTLQTVEHYASKVNRRKLGQAAILKWERKTA